MLVIPNHASATLSKLDLEMAYAVPPGGNWRNIPASLPSARLEQIRLSAAAGEGSRSTYYGRLHPDRPSYTIGTYYNRPGNGCSLHYDAVGGQHRTLSHREAARLQTFPDSFAFHGTQRAVCQQIGNAVPPLLAMQVAEALGEAGTMVDVFAGAGGLSLGFEWAGWQSLVAVDNDKSAVATFNSNIAPVAFLGDMNSDEVQDRLVDSASKRRGSSRMALVGGPPCQGFSTGGNRRTSDDARNSLHKRYSSLLARIRPDIFVFENVLGLLSMDKGQFVAGLLKAFCEIGYEVELWRMNAAEFGVPQRRERVIIVGVPSTMSMPTQPTKWTVPISPIADRWPRPAPGVRLALDDLPKLVAGQDGSGLPYRAAPGSSFQKMVRGAIRPRDYLFGERNVGCTLEQPSALQCVP
jgi:DNA (cytosine-5)-methyltransferase 1